MSPRYTALLLALLAGLPFAGSGIARHICSKVLEPKEEAKRSKWVFEATVVEYQVHAMTKAGVPTHADVKFRIDTVLKGEPGEYFLFRDLSPSYSCSVRPTQGQRWILYVPVSGAPDLLCGNSRLLEWPRTKSGPLVDPLTSSVSSHRHQGGENGSETPEPARSREGSSPSGSFSTDATSVRGRSWLRMEPMSSPRRRPAHAPLEEERTPELQQGSTPLSHEASTP